MSRALSKPTSVLVAFARLRLAFLRGFAKQQAEIYEEHRQGVRWAAEERVFRDLYRQVAPKTVLDCPVGTGRWLDIYQDSGATVLGVDLSPHMLDEARKRLRPNVRVELIEGDVLDPAQGSKLGRDHDLVVCTRFTHWLPTARIAGLVDVFRRTGAHYLLIGVKIRRDVVADPPRQRKGIANALRRARSALLNRYVNYIHDERAVLDIFRAAGGRVAKRALVTKTSSSVYVFYLLDFAPSWLKAA